ncbi:MAG: hypothetical protein JW937_04725 [Candidatus Omnitrophica bacterium]|nr:hypothetical protein [Candidatus Omnitrophota bacterium]
MKRENLRKLLCTTLALATAFGLAFWFRTYMPRALNASVPAQVAQNAHIEVLSALKSQIRNAAQAELESLPETQRAQVVEERARELIQQDRRRYEDLVQKTAVKMIRGGDTGYSRNYLMGADSYHYLGLTRNLLQTGHISDKIQDGRFFSPLQLAPHGAWQPINLHPYLGALWHKLLGGGQGPLELMQRLCSFPLFLCFILCIVFFVLCSAVRTGIFPAFLGCLTLVLSPISIYRGAYGWYDTDFYNLIFPILVLTLFLLGSNRRIHLRLSSVLAGLFTALYALFWEGWLFLPCFILLAGLLPLLLQRFRPDSGMPECGRFLVFYLGSALLFSIAFLSPLGWIRSVGQNLGFLGDSGETQSHLWPSVFLIIGEMTPLTLPELVRHVGHWGVALIGIAGWMLWGRAAWSAQGRRRLAEWILFTLMGWGLILLSLKIERFALLLLIPLSIWVAVGAEHLTGLSATFLSLLHSKWIQRLAVPLSMLLVLLLLVPGQLAAAHTAAMHTKPVMNDLWYKVLREIREKTPEDSIIVTWWPPGHFVRSLAERRVFADGQTLYIPAYYWLARVFMAQTEAEACGILRMLANGGPQTIEFLTGHGIEIPEAIDLLNKVLPLERPQAARRLAKQFNQTDRQKFLDLTHGKGPLPPTYVLLFNSMVEKNQSMALMARWDFHKAFELWPQPSDTPSLLSNRAGYLKTVSEISGPAYQFSPPITVSKVQEDTLLKRTKAGKLSTLFSGEGAQRKAVIADPRLIRSLLFRLYYQEENSLKSFQKLIHTANALAETEILVFRVNWEAQGSSSP